MPARPTRHSGSPSARRLATVLAGGPPTAAFAVHLLTLVVALGALGWLGRPLWFFGDEWEFLVNRGGFHRPHLGLWDPHAHMHWSTTPILIYRALFAVFGLRHYAPYLLLVLLTHIVTAYLLWRVMRRVGVLPWVATGLAAVFCFLGGGEENILWAFQITMNGSLLLGLVHLLLVDRDGGYGGRGGAGRRPGGAHVLRYHRHDDRHIDACRAAPARLAAGGAHRRPARSRLRHLVRRQSAARHLPSAGAGERVCGPGAGHLHVSVDRPHPCRGCRGGPDRGRGRAAARVAVVVAASTARGRHRVARPQPASSGDRAPRRHVGRRA